MLAPTSADGKQQQAGRLAGRPGASSHHSLLPLRPGFCCPGFPCLPADPLCINDNKEHFQWFYFRVSNCADETLNVRIVNAGNASFPRAWTGYNVCVSYDK